METIFHQILINAKPEIVYEMITTKNGLSKWWISDCVVKPILGFVNEFKVEGYVDNKMKIIDLTKNTMVEWECIESDKEWIGTHVIFEISAHKELTKLNFRQTNWESQTEFFGTCNFHWARHLIMLKDLCETNTNQLDNAKELNEIKKVKD
ncbi:SRPBCC domain-containing protein [uncultured Psychroserpens sp.]|uniref:SRPBCC family protein n=1 Tax=uncultured Psychroserpens sp. TaxID=255436 RepID=UPI002615FEA7|nr:SRPBCC domain-containing protein [uncultured Psychroserpens sp.]